MTFWLAAALSAAGFNRRDMAVATTVGGLVSRAAASRGKGGVAVVPPALLCWDGMGLLQRSGVAGAGSGEGGRVRGCEGAMLAVWVGSVGATSPPMGTDSKA